jgi:LacI family transcriptional regulator
VPAVSGEPRPRRPTIEDVAAAVGVSRQTVSRAINDKADITAATRERVLAKIAELGYRPNRLAQGMVTRRTRTVALVAGDIRNPFFAETAHGAGDRLREHQHSLVVIDTHEDAARESAIREIAQDVDGIIAFLYHCDDEVLHELSAAVPALVVVNRAITLKLGRGVSIDRFRAGQLAAQHLISRGHRVLAVASNATETLGRGQRVAGFLAAAADEGIDDVAILEVTPDMAGGRHLGAVLLEDHPEVTGVFAYNDLVACQLVSVLRAGGRAVPDRVAVVGCDDIEIAAAWDPPLTSVRFDAVRLGRIAADHILDLLGVVTQDVPLEQELGVELVVRATT